MWYICVCIVWMSLLSSSWQCGTCCLFIQRLHHLFYLSYFSLPLSPFYPFSWLSPGVVLVSVLPLGHLHRNWMVQTRKRRVPELWVSLSLSIYSVSLELFPILQLQCHIRGWLIRRRWKRVVDAYMTSPHAGLMRKRNQVRERERERGRGRGRERERERKRGLTLDSLFKNKV